MMSSLHELQAHLHFVLSESQESRVVTHGRVNESILVLTPSNNMMYFEASCATAARII